MALIPKKSKRVMISKETLSLEMLLLFMTLMLVTSFFFDGSVHEKFQIFTLPFVVIIVLYLFLPNSKNQGKMGIQRMMIVYHFYVNKWRCKKK